MSRPILHTRSLGLSLADGWLFRNLDLSIPDASFVAITGVSGVGKTSLLRILANELHATTGTVHSSLSKGQRTSMIFQDLQLANGASALANVLSGSLGHHSALGTLWGFPQKEKDTAITWMHRFGLEEKSHQWASTLSRGECQRLAICRTLMSRPTLLLADEPVASLDSGWAHRTLKILKDTQIKNGGSLICTLHDEEQVVAFADYILRLNRESPEEWTWEQVE